MATTDRESNPDLIQELLDTPYEFDFFQAVRLIEIFMTRERRHPTSSPIAGDTGPQKEPIRFRSLPSLSFPPGQVASVRSRNKLPATEKQNSASRLPVDMVVPFMGLTGPNGVMPQHYTTMVIERSHLSNKDDTLKEFFDLFNHRAISFFYRAWEKYRFPVRYERNLFEREFHDDLFTRCLFSLVGLEVPGLRHRFSFDDQAMVFYGGLTAQRCRNAIGLEQILSGYFGIQASVVQFIGQWLYLEDSLQTSLPSRQTPLGKNLTLGESAVAGSRAWDVQSRFCVELGPVRLEEFNQLLPSGSRLPAVAELIRYYVGAEKDFDIRLILHKDDIPELALNSEVAARPQLGWNTWLGKSGRVAHAADATFHF